MDGQPKVGQIVHLKEPPQALAQGPGCRAAIVTHTMLGFMDTPLVGLAVLDSTALRFELGVHGPDPAGCTSIKDGLWHWLESE